MLAESPDEHRLSALASLRRFAQPRPPREHCDLCAAVLPEAHPHLLELSSRRIICVCAACALLFDRPGIGKYRLVPRRVQFLADFRLPEEEWAALHLPIDLAFFLYSSTAERILALYPSPGGATEALPPPDAWRILVADNPILQKMQPDVEALLVNRVASPHTYYLAGIDECYKLVGLIRSHWRGLSGGAAVWKEIERFFIALKKRAHGVGGRSDA